MQKLRDDVSSLTSSLSGHSFFQLHCSDILSAIESWWTVLESNLPAEARGSMENLDDVVKHLDDKLMPPLREALLDAPWGKNLLSEANMLVQLTAKYTAAVKQLAPAMKILQDDRLPLLTESDQVELEGEVCHKISNFTLISNRQIAYILDESLTHVAEALDLFSPQHLTKHSEKISERATTICSSIRVYDEAPCLFSASIFAEAWASSQAPTTPRAMDAEVTDIDDGSSWAHIAKSMDETCTRKRVGALSLVVWQIS